MLLDIHSAGFAREDTGFPVKAHEWF